MPIGPVLVPSGTLDVAAVAAAYNLRLIGFSVAETASVAAAAEVIIRHGTTDADDAVVAPINLDPDGFGVFPTLGPGDGIPCPKGIFVDRVSGTTTLVLYVDRV